MVRVTYILVVLAAWIGSLPTEAAAQAAGAAGSLLPVPKALADKPTVAPPGSAVASLVGSPEPDPLPGLPRPPDQPASLLQPAPAEPVYGCPELERPYFERDPRLDPVELPQPGWLFDAELDIMGSSVVSRVGETAVPIAGVVSVPMAALDWTVSPRFEAGYRLPSGFGELDIAYRFLLAEGTGSTHSGSVASPDAAAVLKSHLNMNVGDVDYASRETSLGPNWDMKWRIGLRTADVFFDSQADELFAAAAAPGASGIFQRSISNNFWGIGPHAALELKLRRNPWGLGWVGRLDAGLLFGDVRQRFVQVPTTPGPSAVTEFDMDEQVPMLSGFLGVDWCPPCHPNLDLLLGYTAEYWWNVGRLSDPDLYNGQSAGEVGIEGVQLRLEYNY